jgi:type IV pilus assembly protein PilM
MVGLKIEKNPVIQNEPLLHKPRPLLGLDIGHGSMKILQLEQRHGKSVVTGYGSTIFDNNAIVDGEIVDLESVAQAAVKLFSSDLIGEVSTRSAAVSLPVTHTYNRVISLPPMENKNISEAVRLEVEQYIPVPLESIYTDYQIINRRADGMDVLVSAAPKKVVDSYVLLFRLLGMELSVLEPSIVAVTRLVRHTELTDVPTLVVDLGSVTTDLIIYDTAVRVTGTINFGGNTITEAISQALNVSEKQSRIIKTKYGLEKSKKQDEILKGLEPTLAKLIAEIRKMIRYYEDRGDSSGRSITVQQVIILGGGANLPGFSTYLTNSLRIATRLCSTWQHIDFGKLQPPHQVENTMYATASGLALITPKDLLV